MAKAQAGETLTPKETLAELYYVQARSEKSIRLMKNLAIIWSIILIVAGIAGGFLGVKAYEKASNKLHSLETELTSYKTILKSYKGSLDEYITWLDENQGKLDGITESDVNELKELQQELQKANSASSSTSTSLQDLLKN